MKKTVFTLSLLLWVISIVPAKDIIPPKNQFILSKNDDRQFGPNLEWVPNQQQTKEALNAINLFLMQKEGDPRAQKIIKNISKYNVQILGIIREKQKIIHCNFFTNNPSNQAIEREYLLVIDGGIDYWNIEYNLTSRNCFNLWINGES